MPRSRFRNSTSSSTFLALKLIGLLSAIGCEDAERAPLYVSDEEDGRGRGGEGGTVSENTGGGTAPGDTEGEAPVSGGSKGPIYLYVPSPNGGKICELPSGDALVGGFTAMPFGQVDPRTGLLWLLGGSPNMGDHVKDIREHEDVCDPMLVSAFSFHPSTSKLYSRCDGDWYSPTGKTNLPAGAMHHDRGSRLFSYSQLYSSNGDVIPLSRELPISIGYRHVHSRTGSGFWITTLTERWSILVNGDVKVDGAYDFPRDFTPSSFFVFDDAGGMYSIGRLGSEYAVARSRFSSSEIVYQSGDGDCEVNGTAGLYTTP